MSRAHRPTAGFWIRVCVAVIYPTVFLLFRIRWHHLDRIPPDGGALLVVNHNSQADPLAVAVLVWQAGRIPRFLIKDGVFGVPVVGRVLSGAGQIPVYRGSSAATNSLRAATAALDAGEFVIIYPEGTLTQDPDYWPMRAKTGVARLALACPDVPIIPVGQWGAQRTLGRNARFRPFPRHALEASVANPVDLRRFAGQEPHPDTLREMTDTIMNAVTAELATIRGGPPPAEPHPWSAPTRHHPLRALRQLVRRETSRPRERSSPHDASSPRDTSGRS
jgi:1-acyl-sn-glycerol-3-phosphate acyltransferase